MLKNWRQLYKELTYFVAAHPEIKLGKEIIEIPENFRPEFYRLFDAVRAEFVEEKSSDFVNQALSLSKNYIVVEQDVIETLALSEVSLSGPLRWFLDDPIDGLKRNLFDPLFDLVRGRMNIDKFETMGSESIGIPQGELYRLGYQYWLMLSLIKMLEPESLYTVNVLDIGADFSHDKARALTNAEESVPPPEKAKKLSLMHRFGFSTFVVPDFIFHSAKINRYVAARTELKEATWTANNASKVRKWNPLDPTIASIPGLIPVYVADNPIDISLVNDAKKICRPDLVIECKEQKDWYTKEGLEKVKLHHDSLKPRLGTYVVSREPVPEQAFRELMSEQVTQESMPKHIVEEPTSGGEAETWGEDIQILTVGFDQTKLGSVISALMQTENKD